MGVDAITTPNLQNGQLSMASMLNIVCINDP